MSAADDSDDEPMSAVCDIGDHDDCMVGGCVCFCHDENHVAKVLTLRDSVRPLSPTAED